MGGAAHMVESVVGFLDDLVDLIPAAHIVDDEVHQSEKVVRLGLTLGRVDVAAHGVVSLGAERNLKALLAVTFVLGDDCGFATVFDNQVVFGELELALFEEDGVLVADFVEDRLARIERS